MDQLREMYFRVIYGSRKMTIVLKDDEQGRYARSTIVQMIARGQLRQLPEEADWQNKITIEIPGSTMVEIAVEREILPGVKSITV